MTLNLKNRIRLSGRSTLISRFLRIILKDFEIHYSSNARAILIKDSLDILKRFRTTLSLNPPEVVSLLVLV